MQRARPSSAAAGSLSSLDHRRQRGTQQAARDAAWVVQGAAAKLREPTLVARGRDGAMAAVGWRGVREGGAFLRLPACRGMDLPAVVVLPDASSSFLPPLDMHSTIPCPLPAGQRKVSSFICFFPLKQRED